MTMVLEFPEASYSVEGYKAAFGEADFGFADEATADAFAASVNATALEAADPSWAAAATYVEKGAAVAAGFFWVAVDATFATVDAFALAAFDAAGALEVV